MIKDFSPLEDSLGIQFENRDLLTQAFIHRSYLNEKPNFSLGHNERLEFLGDAVLELVVTEDLFEKYPDKPEGEMTNWRAALVNSKMLSGVAKELGFDDFIILSQGEQRERGKARQYILADAMESFIGALYLDRGYESCQKFIKEYIMARLPHIIEAGLYRDAKSSFQEKSQEKVSITPNYKTLKETGPDHRKQFTIGVYLGKNLIAKGVGSSKQEAEEEAAKNALDTKDWKKV